MPWYADVLEGTVSSDDEDIQAKSVPPRSVLVRSLIGWQRQMAKWIAEQRESLESEGGALSAVSMPHGKKAAWLPLPLNVLFGGNISCLIASEQPCQKQFDRKVLLIELLAAEHSDEAPDDGAIEGSDDNYDE